MPTRPRSSWLARGLVVALLAASVSPCPPRGRGADVGPGRARARRTRWSRRRSPCWRGPRVARASSSSSSERPPARPRSSTPGTAPPSTRPPWACSGTSATASSRRSAARSRSRRSPTAATSSSSTQDSTSRSTLGCGAIPAVTSAAPAPGPAAPLPAPSAAVGGWFIHRSTVRFQHHVGRHVDPGPAGNPWRSPTVSRSTVGPSVLIIGAARVFEGDAAECLRAWEQGMLDMAVAGRRRLDEAHGGGGTPTGRAVSSLWLHLAGDRRFGDGARGALRVPHAWAMGPSSNSSSIRRPTSTRTHCWPASQ